MLISQLPKSIAATLTGIPSQKTFSLSKYNRIPFCPDVFECAAPMHPTLPEAEQRIAMTELLARAPDILLIPGTLRLDHLQDNLAAAGLDLPREMLAAPGARVAGEVV